MDLEPLVWLKPCGMHKQVFRTNLNHVSGKHNIAMTQCF